MYIAFPLLTVDCLLMCVCLICNAENLVKIEKNDKYFPAKRPERHDTV